VTSTTQPALRPNIAKEMQDELLSRSVETFISHYMPFSPSAENIRCARDVLVGSGHLDQWKAFGRTNPSSSTEREQKVLKPLGMIVNTLLGLEVTDPTTCQLRHPSFRYTDCPNQLLKGESVGSAASTIDACMRLEGMRFDQLLGSDTAIIAEFKKRTERASKWYARVVDGHGLQLMSKSE